MTSEDSGTLSRKRRTKSMLLWQDSARRWMRVPVSRATVQARAMPSPSDNVGRVAANACTDEGPAAPEWLLRCNSVSLLINDGECGVIPAVPATSRTIFSKRCSSKSS